MALTVLTAHMTELEAVNQMLRSIGEQPVSDLNGGQIDAEQAQSILAETSRRIQAQGWHANTRYGVSYSRDANNYFGIPQNVLKVDSVNADSPRRSSTPNPSSFYNVGLRRNSTDDGYILYDLDNDSETWANGPSTMVCDVVEYLEFRNLPTHLQQYIYKAAAHEFQKSAVQSTRLYEFTLEDVQIAMADAIQSDSENEDRNMHRNNRSNWEVVYRYNPLYNT
jgi:hypothetical protein